MLRRSKIILINGQPDKEYCCLSRRLTIAPYQRVNIDHITFVVALRYPSYIPTSMDVDDVPILDTIIKSLKDNILLFLDHLDFIDKKYLIASEYANLPIDLAEVRLVEGISMKKSWVYQTIRTIHKQLDQQITEVDLYPDGIEINEKMYGWEEGIDLLKPIASDGI